MYYRALFVLLPFLWITPTTYAQQDSLWTIKWPDSLLLVQTRLPHYGMGQRYAHLDSARLAPYQGRHLGQVLALESTLFVKDYGPSGISTLSGRGGGASHTAVLWEGFAIQNPMLGQSDLSLLPAAFVDYVQIQYGSGSALFGNSSLGGAIHLGTTPQFGCGWRAQGQLSYGSYERLQQNIKVHYSNNQYTASIRLLRQQARNNFWYKDRNAFGLPKPLRQQTHARTEQTGLLLEQALHYRSHQFRFKTWYQHHDRQLPATLLVSSSTDQQTDRSWRSTLQWKQVGEQATWNGRTGLFWEELWFKNDAVNSLSRIWASITALERQWYWQQQRLQIGGQYAYYTALSSGYKQRPEEHRTALFVAYQWEDQQERWRIAASVRQALVDVQWMRPAASLGGRWKAHKYLLFNLQLSHNYRLPTFNDRYWQTLGNPDLLPEYSWNGELGLTLPFSIQKLNVEGGLHGFGNWVDQWILWSPNDAGLWRPSNVERVWASGAEARLQVTYPFPRGVLRFHANYAYTRSIRLSGKETSTLGKQLIYTPIHQGNAAVTLSYAGHQLLYQHQWTGERYTNNANTTALPFFQVGHLRYSYQWQATHSQWSVYVQVYNLFGEDYQVVAARAMPWQQVEIGIQWSI